MHFFKPSFALLALALVAAPLATADTTVTSETHDKEDYPNKPAKPLLACVMKSRTCKSTTHYTDLNDYVYNFKLGVCHHDSFAKNIANWVWPSRATFFNTFYVSCHDRDTECKRKAAELKPNEIAHVFEDKLDDKTHCDAKVRCYHLDEVDEHCYPK